MANQNQEEKTYTLTDEEIESVCGGTSSRIPGMTCPNCGKFIPTSIMELCVQKRLRCPYCLLVMNIDSKNLNTAMDAFKDKK